MKRIFAWHRHLVALTSAGILAGLTATSATAQQDRYHLALLGIQSGTVAPSGIGFAAISYTNKRGPGLDDADGSAVLGLGFGNMSTGIGVQATAHILSLSDDFGDSGNVSLKFARQLQSGPNPVYGSLRLGRLLNWGDAKGLEETASLAVTRYGSFTTGNGVTKLPVMMTFGVGSHVRNFETDPGVFGGIGIGLSPSLAASVAWTGDGLNIGTGFKIKGLDDVAFGLSFEDVTDRVDNRRVVFSVGFNFNAFGG